MKLCQNCHENPISVKLTEVIDGKKKELFLCEVCTKKREVILPMNLLPLKTSQQLSLLSTSNPDDILESTNKKICNKCGSTFNHFRKKSLLGCSNDYIVFEEELKEMLQKIHGASKHHGKMPSHTVGDLSKEKLLLRLKERLKKMVHQEKYEKAAELRDRILRLEQGEGHGT